MLTCHDLAPNITYVIYDGDCPVCSRYTQYIRFQETVGEVVLVNCREQPVLLAELKAQGYNLNDGMLLRYKNAWHYGDQAVFMMAALASPSNCFNRFNAFMFKSPRVVKYIYPAMVVGRKALLFILNKKQL